MIKAISIITIERFNYVLDGMPLKNYNINFPYSSLTFIQDPFKYFEIRVISIVRRNWKIKVEFIFMRV